MTTYITNNDNCAILKKIFSNLHMFRAFNYATFLNTLKMCEGVMTGSKIIKLLTSDYDITTYDPIFTYKLISKYGINESDLDVCVKNYEKFDEYLLAAGFVNVTPEHYRKGFGSDECYIKTFIKSEFALVEQTQRYQLKNFTIDVIVSKDPINTVCNTFDLKYCARCVDSDFVQYSNCDGIEGPTKYQSDTLIVMSNHITEISYWTAAEFVIKFSERIAKYTNIGMNIYYEYDILNKILGKSQYYNQSERDISQIIYKLGSTIVYLIKPPYSSYTYFHYEKTPDKYMENEEYNLDYLFQSANRDLSDDDSDDSDSKYDYQFSTTVVDDVSKNDKIEGCCKNKECCKNDAKHLKTIEMLRDVIKSKDEHIKKLNKGIQTCSDGLKDIISDKSESVGSIIRDVFDDSDDSYDSDVFNDGDD